MKKSREEIELKKQERTDMIRKAVEYADKNRLTPEELEERIVDAKNLDDLDILRILTVQSKTRSIINLWQKRYTALKNK